MSKDNPYLKDPPTDFDDLDHLSEDAAEEQIEMLGEAIEHHDQKYYVEDEPIISDASYDDLFERLQRLEEEFPEFASENSPTSRVGAPPIDELDTVEHEAKLLSLDAVDEREEVEEFVDKVRDVDSEATFFVEPKFDGLSLEVVYEDRELTRAATRGDGEKGEDVTANARTIRTLPLRLKVEAPEFVAVRGEAYMSRNGFAELNERRVERGEDPFANPRNAAAGSLRQLDPGKIADRPIEIFFYDLLEPHKETSASGQANVRELLRSWGLRTDDLGRACDNVDEIEAFYDEMLEQRDTLDFEVDGIVVKADEFSVRDEMGSRSRSPRWALAWKFPPKREVTTLRDIAVQVGRTGKLTPVALLDPVDVGGVTVSRASLHNAEEVGRLDVRPGDRVRIQRAGDVIPEVAERVERGDGGKEFEMPSECPSCGAEVTREGPLHFCPDGLTCPAQIRGRIEHYGSRDALDIEGLGEKTVEELDMVTNVADLYSLGVEDLEQLEGFAEKSAEKLHDEIQKAKDPTLDRFLYALGIRHVGSHVATLLARHFASLDELMEASAADLTAIDEVGEEIADAIVEFFGRDENQKVIDALLDAGVDPQPVEDETGGPLAGNTFVFTGALGQFTRDEAQAEVERRGARATSSVSGDTDYLVVGDDPGRKLSDARNEDVEIIDEDEFLELIEEPG